ASPSEMSVLSPRTAQAILSSSASSSFFTASAATTIFTLSLHDALPIFARHPEGTRLIPGRTLGRRCASGPPFPVSPQKMIRITRSEEHTSELQSLAYLVCRLLLEKKKYDSIGLHLFEKNFPRNAYRSSR